MGLAWEIGGAGLAVHGEEAGVRRAWQVAKVKLACWFERGRALGAKCPLDKNGHEQLPLFALF